MSTIVRPLAWLPSSSRAPNVKLKPGPPAQPIPSRCPRRGPLPGTLATAEPRAFPVRTGASSPCGTRVPLHGPASAGRTQGHKCCGRPAGSPAPGSVRTATHHRAHPAHALGCRAGARSRGGVCSLDEPHTRVGSGVTEWCSVCPLGAARA